MSRRGWVLAALLVVAATRPAAAQGGASAADGTGSSITAAAEWRNYGLDTKRHLEYATDLLAWRHYLWIGYLDGALDRYDAATDYWTHYELPTGLTGERINALAQVDQYLYVGTDAGLAVFDLFLETFVSRPEADALHDSAVIAIANDLHALYFAVASRDPFNPAQPSGLVRYDKSYRTARLFTAADGLASDQVNDILIRSQVWIATDQGLTRYDPDREKFTSYSYTSGFSANRLLKLAVAGDRIWIGGAGKIWEFDPAGEAVREFDLGNEENYKVTVVSAVDDLVLFGTAERGLIGYDRAHDLFFPVRGGELLPTTSAVEKFAARLWVASGIGTAVKKLAAAPLPDSAPLAAALTGPPAVLVTAEALRERSYYDLVDAAAVEAQPLAPLRRVVTALAGKDRDALIGLMAALPNRAALLGQLEGFLADTGSIVSGPDFDETRIMVRIVPGGRRYWAADGGPLFNVRYRRTRAETAGLVAATELTAAPTALEFQGDHLVRWQ